MAVFQVLCAFSGSQVDSSIFGVIQNNVIWIAEYFIPEQRRLENHFVEKILKTALGVKPLRFLT